MPICPLSGPNENEEQTEPTVRNDVIVTTTTQDDLNLIVAALSAYQHNTRYRALYLRLVRQIERRNGAVHMPLLLANDG